MICAHCRVDKPKAEFHANRSRPTGLQNYCKPCMLASTAASKARHIDRLRPVFAARQKARRHANIERYTATDKRAKEKLRREVMAAYGGVCACCGELDDRFLTVDHIHGDGAAHRKEFGSRRSIYPWLRMHGFPRDRFQLLCFNCNIAKSIYGECPHVTVAPVVPR